MVVLRNHFKERGRMKRKEEASFEGFGEGEKKKDSTETKKDDKVRKHANPFPTTPCQEVC